MNMFERHHVNSFGHYLLGFGRIAVISVQWEIFFFLGVKSIYIYIYIFPSADIDKHIFEKYFKSMEKQSIIYFLKNKKTTTERIIIASMSEDNRQA